ncbi:MAG: methyltransferase domain-containing protein, partial [Methanotrichaceae archaeon]|nr:methyltransferase domain-containing protein [Methanotrichaceae archaeon]
DAFVGRTRSELEAGIVQTKSDIVEEVDALVCRTRSELEAGIVQTKSEIEEKIRKEANAIISSMNQDIQNKAWLASILDNRLEGYESISLSSDLHSDYEGTNYFVFEEIFRGSREDIKERQSALVRIFDECKDVLDIGCGRGEFLELLREMGVDGHGVDINEDMVNYCKSKGLDVKRIDAMTYLEGIEDKSLGGVFLDQVVEHLQSDYLVKMLGLCYKKLKYGHHIVVETVNPLSLSSLANFYIDLTHKRPVHPETLKFLFESVGFREIEVKFLSPLPDKIKLSKISPDCIKDESDRRLINTYNSNIDILNNILFGAQDYIIIGKK